jgi:cytochrome b6-f complex iron-sulfur subunit
VPEPTRREFVHDAARLIAGSAVVGAAAPFVAACAPHDPTLAWKFRTIVDVSQLVADGQAIVTDTPGVDGARILIVRTARDAFTALSTQCTHEGCPVTPPVTGVITCPCHGSQYGLDGAVRRGPALYPLTRYLTSYETRAGKLTVGTAE